MSGANSQGLSNHRAAELEAEATAWVRRQHFDTWSAADQAALDVWLAESVGHQVAYWRMSAGFDCTERLTALRTPAQSQNNLEGNGKRQPFAFRVATGLMAVCLVAAIGFVIAPKQESYATAVGGHQTVHLVDGSQIELNTDTNLRVSTDIFGQRTAWLDRGEAFFSIKHDDDHPFILLAAGHRLTDLGTKFVVRADTSHVRIALMEGAIRLESEGQAAQQQRATLVPGDVAIADASSLLVEKKTEPELQREESWRRGLLIFKRTTLEDAVAEFNRYNASKLRIENREIAKLQIGGTFSSTDPALFARATSTMLGLRIVDRGTEMIIAR
jgi:transmembrane sensor